MTPLERQEASRAFLEPEIESEEESIVGGELEDVEETPLHEPSEQRRQKTFTQYNGIDVRDDISIGQVRKIIKKMDEWDRGFVPRRGYSAHKEETKQANLEWLAQRYPDRLRYIMEYFNGLPGDAYRHEMSGDRIYNSITRLPAQPAVSSNVARQAAEVIAPAEEEEVFVPEIIREEEEESDNERERLMDEALDEIQGRKNNVPQMWRGGAVYYRRKKSQK